MAISTLFGAAVLLAGPSQVTQAQLEDLVRQQAATIQLLEARVGQLEARVAGPAPAANGPSAPAPLQIAPPPGADAAPRVAAVAPPVPSFKIRGRLHADAWSASDPGVSGTELRRGRMGMEGRLDPKFSYLIEVDFAGNVVSLQDALFDYALGSRTTLRAGYHKAPFSLDDQTSDNYNLFLEHPAGIDPFVPGRGVGVAVMSYGEHWYGHFGVFGEKENRARDGVVDENVTVAGRAAWAPINSGGRFLHVAAAGYATKFGDDPALRMREKPERNLSTYFVDTGPLDAKDMVAAGLELSYGAGPFGVASEAARARITDRFRRELEYGGYSVEGWWTLTGEARPYKVNGAVFDRLKPAHPVGAGGLGAIQLVARYSALDLSDADLNAGHLSVGTLGLNWYWTERARLSVDLNHARVERQNLVTRSKGIGGRLQFDW